MSGIFDKLYDATDEIKKAMKKPLLKNSLKRKLSSAYDDAERQIDDAEMGLQTNREDILNYDVNTILDQLETIARCKELQTQIAAEYKELFGEDMPKITE